MDDYQPPEQQLLEAISARTDRLKSPLFAMYLRFFTLDMGNNIMYNTLDGLPDTIAFMKSLAEQEGLPDDIIESIGDFSAKPTMDSRKKLIKALKQYIEPFNEDCKVGEIYLDLKYPGRPASHEAE